MQAQPHRITSRRFARCRFGVSLGLALAGALSVPLLAQTGETLLAPLPMRSITLQPAGVPSRGYSDRAITEVYDNFTNAFVNGSSTHLGSCSHVLDDIRFENGPWDLANYPLPRVISDVSVGVGVLTTPTTSEDILIVFWDEDDINFQGIGGAGTSMIRPNATPLGVASTDASGLLAGFYWQVTCDLIGLPGGGIAVPGDDNGLGLQVAWVNDGYVPPDTNGDGRPNWEDLSGGLFEPCPSATNRSLVFASSTGAPVRGNPASVGVTSISYGRDMANNAALCAHIGRFIGNGSGPAAAGEIEHRYMNATPQRGFMTRLRGYVQTIEPGCPTPPLGPIPDAGVSVTRTLLPNEATLFCFSLGGNATDAANQFFDIDTEGSLVDTSIGLWDSLGRLIATNDDDGSGVHAQLTFGMGIRFSVGDGEPYNGRHGEIVAGPYYLGVGTGPAGATTFGNGYARASTGPGGSVTVRFATNANGTPLAPPVPPRTVVPVLNGGLPLVAPGVRPAPAQVAPASTIWYEFETCAITSPTRYLDLHTNETPLLSTDTEVFLFNDAGLLVATDDDAGTEFFSQLSFGSTIPRAAPGNGEPYAGQNGNLAAGRYYLAVTLFDATAPGTRWHVRPISTTSASVRVALETDSTGMCVRCHGRCVADMDDGTGTGTPDDGVTVDDLLYFLGAFEQGAECADVDDGSATGTPDGGVTIDDLLYYLVRFEAEC